MLKTNIPATQQPPAGRSPRPHVLLSLPLAPMLSPLAPCLGQGSIRFGFEGPPPQPRGTAYWTEQYYESGVWFRPLGVVGPGNGFGRSGGGVAFYPENGTAYLVATLGDSLMFSFTNGTLFDLISVDLAEYSTVVPDAVTVPFVCYRQDGSAVTVYFTTDGIIDGTGPLADFQTFTFDNRFRNLARVEIPAYGWSLDNLVLRVPEPAPATLLLAAAGLLCASRRRNAVTDLSISPSRPR